MQADEEYRQIMLETSRTAIGMILAGISQYCRINSARMMQAYDEEDKDMTKCAIYSGNIVAFDRVAKHVDEMDAYIYEELAKALDEYKKNDYDTT